MGGEQGVPRCLPRQDRTQGQPLRQRRRHVLHRVLGTIDPAVQQRFFNFFGEQLFAADLRQLAIQDAVTGRLDHDDLNRVGRSQVCVGRAQPAHHLFGLCHGQGAAPAAQTDLRCHPITGVTETALKGLALTVAVPPQARP